MVNLPHFCQNSGLKKTTVSPIQVSILLAVCLFKTVVAAVRYRFAYSPVWSPEPSTWTWYLISLLRRSSGV